MAVSYTHLGRSTMTNLTEFKRWENGISRMHFPKWEELPSLGLYVDQVAAVINEYLTSLGMERCV